MSLNNIHLTPPMLVRLYSDTLVETNSVALPGSKSFNYLGNNQKKILVIVSHQYVPFLPDGELDFLTTILAACRLSIADIAIVNYCNADQRELQNLIDTQAKNILLFGIDPPSIKLPINFPQFQLQQFDKHTYLHAPTLAELENDKSLKLKLWNSLKQLFGL